MLGRSQSWTRALETISGDVRMDAKALLSYFDKLHTWLKEDNDKHDRLRGWRTRPPVTPETSVAPETSVTPVPPVSNCGYIMNDALISFCHFLLVMVINSG